MREALSLPNERETLIDAAAGVFAVLRRVQTPVDEPGHRAARNVAAGVGAAVVDQHGVVGQAYPAVAEGDVRDVADAFALVGCEEVAARAGDDLRGILQRGHEHIEDVAQAGRAVAHAVGEV